jgi:hypothetical protein
VTDPTADTSAIEGPVGWRDNAYVATDGVPPAPRCLPTPPDRCGEPALVLAVVAVLAIVVGAVVGTVGVIAWLTWRSR